MNTYWIAKEYAHDFANPTEPAKYPDKFLPLVPKIDHDHALAAIRAKPYDIDTTWVDATLKRLHETADATIYCVDLNQPLASGSVCDCEGK